MNDDIKNNVLNRVKIIAPQIELNDDKFLIFIEDAIQEAKEDGFTSNKLIIASSYLACHFAFVSTRQNSNIKVEKADVLQREYFQNNGGSDYLTEYERLKDNLNKDNDFNKAVMF